jgi:hypothetical protein
MPGEPQACSLKYLASNKVQLKTVKFPEGEAMHLLDRAVLPTSVPPCLTLPCRNLHALNALKVVFSITGDLIKIPSVHGWMACGPLPPSGWLQSRQMTAPGWLERLLASGAAMIGAMG